MNIQEIETFRGLVKSSDINALRLLIKGLVLQNFLKMLLILLKRFLKI